MNYSEYAKILKQVLCDKEIDEDALKIYNSVNVNIEMLKSSEVKM